MKPSESPPKRAAVYLRVSTEEQALEGYGLNVQKTACEDYARAFGMIVVATFRDPGVSGIKDIDMRPGLWRALHAAHESQFDVLIVASIDRLARSGALGLKLYDDFEAAGVGIACVRERLDTSSPTGRLIRTFFLALAEFERDLIIERTQAGRAIRAALDGDKGGRLPYGYRRVADGVEIVPEAAEAVRLAFALHKRGSSLRAIAAALSHLTGKRWRPSSVAVVLGNAAIYRGNRRGDSPVRWPAIIGRAAR
jgi:site-specific DNA recombinase